MIDMALKRCPHCGGTGTHYMNYSPRARQYYVYVACEICGAQGKPFKTRESPVENDWDLPECEQAAAAWNMRYTEV